MVKRKQIYIFDRFLLVFLFVIELFFTVYDSLVVFVHDCRSLYRVRNNHYFDMSDEGYSDLSSDGCDLDLVTNFKRAFQAHLCVER